MNQETEIETVATELVQKSTILAIANRKEYDYAAGLLLNIKNLQHRISKTFDPIIKKAHETHKESLLQKNSLVKPLQEAEAFIKKTMLGYLSTLQLEVKDDAPKVDGISIRSAYSFEIVDESKLPREYLKPDEIKIRRVVTAMGNNIVIPGVKIFESDTLAVSKGG